MPKVFIINFSREMCPVQLLSEHFIISSNILGKKKWLKYSLLADL